jgi:hypothetical protein
MPVLPARKEKDPPEIEKYETLASSHRPEHSMM